jgi:hypothetical protein
MFKYVVLPYISSEIFSNLLSELTSLWDSRTLLNGIAIDILLAVSYFLIRTWFGFDK